MATYWENSCSFGLRYVSWYGCLIVSFVFSHLGFWSGNLFLIAPFPDLCLLVPFLNSDNQVHVIEAFNSTSRYLDDLLNIDIDISHRVYHKILEETNPFAIERCKPKKGAWVSVLFALFNCSSGG